MTDPIWEPIVWGSLAGMAAFVVVLVIGDAIARLLDRLED